MPSPTEVVDAKQKEIEQERKIKEKYKKFKINFFKDNSAYARIKREFSLNYMERLDPKLNYLMNEQQLYREYHKRIKLSETGLAVMKNAVWNLKQDKEIEFKKGVETLEDRNKEFQAYMNKSYNLLTDFTTLIQKRDSGLASLFFPQIDRLKRDMIANAAQLEEIIIAAYSDTIVMSGIAPPAEGEGEGTETEEI